MLTWGIVLALHVPVSNKEGLYTVRFFLGLAEAGKPRNISKIVGIADTV